MKNYLFALSFLFLSSLNLISQDSNELQFGFSFNPKYTSPLIKNTEIREGRNTYSYSLSADLYYFISKKIELKSGFNFTQLKYEELDYNLTFGCDINTSSGFDLYNSFTRGDYQLFYLGVPLEMRFKIGNGEKNKLYWKIGGEILYKVFENNLVFLVECGMEEREISSSINNAASDLISKLRSGIGIETNFLKDKKLYFEPQMEYAFNGLFEIVTFSGAANRVNFFEIGLLLGVRF